MWTFGVDEDAFRTKMHQLFKSGHSRAQTFSILYRELYSTNARDINHLNESFRLFDENARNWPSFNQRSLNLFEDIVEEWSKFKSAIAEWNTFPVNYFAFLDSRYALTYHNDSKTELRLLDNFHGTSRVLSVKGQFPQESSLHDIHFEIIDHELLFLFECPKSSEPHFYIHLCKLDYNKSECNVLATQKLDGDYWHITFDCRNPRNFVIFACNNYGSCLWLGRITEDLNLLIDPKFIRFYLRDDCSRLDGDKFQMINFSDWYGECPKELDTADFGEYTLLPGQDRPDEKTLFRAERPPEFDQFCIQKYRWHGKILHGFGLNLETKQHFYLHLDLDTQKIKMQALKLYGEDRVEDFFVDENDQSLTICYRLSKSFGVYRIILNQPDSLANLTLFKLRRDKTQNLPELSDALRPFTLTSNN